jgi:hypothetical protein
LAIDQPLIVPLEDKVLRKAWLKKNFASWEYLEVLLDLHDDYLTSPHRHWARPEILRQFPDHYRSMQSPVFLRVKLLKEGRADGLRNSQ